MNKKQTTEEYLENYKDDKGNPIADILPSAYEILEEEIKNDYIKRIETSIVREKYNSTNIFDPRFLLFGLIIGEIQTYYGILLSEYVAHRIAFKNGEQKITPNAKGLGLSISTKYDTDFKDKMLSKFAKFYLNQNPKLNKHRASLSDNESLILHNARSALVFFIWNNFESCISKLFDIFIPEEEKIKIRKDLIKSQNKKYFEGEIKEDDNLYRNKSIFIPVNRKYKPFLKMYSDGKNHKETKKFLEVFQHYRNSYHNNGTYKGPKKEYIFETGEIFFVSEQGRSIMNDILIVKLIKKICSIYFNIIIAIDTQLLFSGSVAKNN
ncbi:MAG: hypothetical protein GY710_08455 [Desulfobacteraceae bacterium]|nr:hypothetical protein [Desulfobacteraceae bacterium]